MNRLFEGMFGNVNQVINRLLVAVEFAYPSRLDCVELISGDLHTSKLDDDVSVVCII